ncbi:MAG: zinc ribbon domain-containing protein [Oscillospiraceae bacterium]|jgi:DNA-directed RNA polymerase subunit RPC12/RpoP|nr:zinc ribbon domain-containing protein [Oscillospiraceae bacterium]
MPAGAIVALTISVLVCIALYIHNAPDLHEESGTETQLYPVGCCQNCGNPLAENAKFCNKCGTKVPEPVALAGVNCPNCGSTDLQAVVENKTNVRGGGYSLATGCCGSIFLGPIGWLCGAGSRKTRTHSRNTHYTHYWICKKCGTKFKNEEASGGWF